MKLKLLLASCIAMALATAVAGTLGRKETLLYATLMFGSALVFGNEVEKNEE